MKSLSVVLLFGTSLFAQGVNFTTGQAARLVIGQTTFTSQDPNSSDVILGAASGLAFAADTLFVADSNRVGAIPSNHRILLYKGASSMFPSPTAEFTASSKCPVCVGKASVVLGQPDFTTSTLNLTASRSGLRLPTAVASDGIHLVVADTDHNRVLIWNQIPSVNNQPADVVVGQPDFSSTLPSTSSPTAKSMRGPQGVWIQNGKLYVADTQDNRVMIYNRIPTANGAAADVVLGAPNFTTFVEPDLTQQKTSAAANNLLNPVAVTSDGVRLFVTDLGYNRVLMWNSIPSSNGAAADLALGQPNLNSSAPDNGFSADANGTETAVLCPTPIGTDANNNPTFNARCSATLNFPRFALSTGDRVFIADGGADRVLVYNTIPTQNGASADLVIGQIGGSVNQASDAADSLRTPMSMAWDGVNLYVSDAYNRRITVYSLGATTVPYQGVRNAASINIVASGTITIGGTAATAKDIITVTIGGTNYTYTVVANDTIASIVQGLVTAINTSNSGAGDPSVTATVDTTSTAVVLTAKTAGSDGNNVTYSATVSSNATETATAAGTNLTGGADSAKVAAGTIVQIQGTNLSAQTVAADTSKPNLPTKLGGTSVYFNGIPAPLYYVSPTQINAQVPWDFGFDLKYDPNDPTDTTSINAYVRSELADGSVMVTTPVAVTIVTANPGLFTQGDPTAGTAVAVHGSSAASGVISIDGTVTANDVATVTIEDRSYSYTVQSTDTLDSIRDNLVSQINNDPKVTATASGQFDRIIVKARIEGPEGNGIAIGGSASAAATVIVTAITQTLCCANVQGALITPDNPAQPGEIINVFATGLGLPVTSGDVGNILQNGAMWPNGLGVTTPQVSVSALAGGRTADVISATLMPGTVGGFLLVLHLNGDIPTDPATVLTIAQGDFVSNAVRMPVVNLATGTATAQAVANTVKSDAQVRALKTAPSARSRRSQPRGSVRQ